MLDENPRMGGTGIAIDRREAASALRWWLESGVDAATQESPRNWFERAPATHREDEPAPPPSPESLDGFQRWLASPSGPLASPGSKPIAPKGSECAEIMLLCEPPTRDELSAGEPIGGAAAELMQRMLQSIGLAGHAYSANLACFHSPGPRLSNAQLEQCADAARKHIALVRPKRLLLLGDLPSRALVGKPLLQARGHVHKVEGVRTIATFHPRQLLKRPSDKALAWRDLLLMMEETP
jgi:DNA polymerase